MTEIKTYKNLAKYTIQLVKNKLEEPPRVEMIDYSLLHTQEDVYKIIISDEKYPYYVWSHADSSIEKALSFLLHILSHELGTDKND